MKALQQENSICTEPLCPFVMFVNSEAWDRCHTSTSPDFHQACLDSGGVGKEVHSHHWGVPPYQRHEGTHWCSISLMDNVKWSGLYLTVVCVSSVQQEALQCVQEMNSTQLLFVFVRSGLESTLERSTIAREHMGLLLHQLIKTGILPTQHYYKGSV